MMLPPHLGAIGALGRHVLRFALAAGHDVTVFVRTPSKLPDRLRISIDRLHVFSVESFLS